jgi:predicted nucleic acid-binding protein
MILVDTSVWVDHLRKNHEALAGLLNRGAVLVHPFIIGELALGQMQQREIVLTSLAALPRAAVATDADVLRFIERHALTGRGVGYVDVHLLAAVRLTEAAWLWTIDKRLDSVADELGLAVTPPFDHRAMA